MRLGTNNSSIQLMIEHYLTLKEVAKFEEHSYNTNTDYILFIY